MAYRHKRSLTAGAVPTSGDIGVGELAVNIADGVMHSSDGAAIAQIGIKKNGDDTKNGALEVNGELSTSADNDIVSGNHIRVAEGKTLYADKINGINAGVGSVIEFLRSVKITGDLEITGGLTLPVGSSIIGDAAAFETIDVKNYITNTDTNEVVWINDGLKVENDSLLKGDLTVEGLSKFEDNIMSTENGSLFLGGEIENNPYSRYVSNDVPTMHVVQDNTSSTRVGLEMINHRNIDLDVNLNSITTITTESPKYKMSDNMTELSINTYTDIEGDKYIDPFGPNIRFVDGYNQNVVFEMNWSKDAFNWDDLNLKHPYENDKDFADGAPMITFSAFVPTNDPTGIRAHYKSDRLNQYSHKTTIINPYANIYRYNQEYDPNTESYIHWYTSDVQKIATEEYVQEEIAAQPQIHINDAAPTNADGNNGDIWIEY